MTPELKQHFDELIEQAIKDTAVHVKNSTERTNSSLIADLWEKFKGELKPTLKPIINELVNGKINNLTEMQKEQNIVLEGIKKQIEKINQETEPIIEKNKESTIIHKYVGKFGGTIIKVGAVFSAISFIVLGALSVIKYIK